MASFARIKTEAGPRFAELVLGGYRLLSAAPWNAGTPEGPVQRLKPELLCPVTPSKIVCIGRNYRAHAKELGNEVPKEPLLFFKPPSALLAPGGSVILPRQSQRVEHEAELGVVVGQRLVHADIETATKAIFGLTCVCDVTARDLQKTDGQWTRAKGFDTFCPVGPTLVTGVEWQGRDIVCAVDGEVRQNGNTRDMVFGVPELLVYISAAMTLEPGDLVVTGTPEGVGPLLSGQSLEVRISGVGVLAVTIAA